MAGDWLHGWWLALSCIEDHKTQVRCSAVCKQWEVLCRTLPKLKIRIDFRGKEEAERFIQRALWRRSELQELTIDYDCPYIPVIERAPADERNVLLGLRDVSAHLKILYLNTPPGTRYTMIWSRLAQDFPQLQSLSVMWGSLPRGKALGIAQEHRNLKKITLCFMDAMGSHVEELVNFCPSLENLSAGPLYGPLNISSRSLVKISLYNNLGKTYITAPKLRALRLVASGPTTVANVPELRDLRLCRVKIFDIEPLQLLNVARLIFSSQNLSSMSRLMSSAKNMKHLVVTGDYGNAGELRLEQLVRPQVEFLGIQTDLLRSLRAHEGFSAAGTEEADYEKLMNAAEEWSDLPRFSLKMATLDLRDLQAEPDANQIAFHLLRVFCQLLVCSPQLKYLLVTRVGNVLHPLFSRLKHPRYYVSSGRCPEAEWVSAGRKCFGGASTFD